MDVIVRPARLDDEVALMALDQATWTWLSSPAPPPPPGTPFFAPEQVPPEDVLVAERDGRVVGYLQIAPPTPLASNAHVLMVRGFAVSADARRLGIGRRLLDAAVATAARRGARRLTLRVLEPNEGARRLYESCGFEVEGVLRGEFHLEGRDVDDVLMARVLGGPQGT